MEDSAASRLGIAIAISIGLHLFIAVVGEISSDGAPRKAAQEPPVEITRVALDGAKLPEGPGESKFNSLAAPQSRAFGQKYNLDAGVPMQRPIPANPPASNAPVVSNSPAKSEPGPTTPQNPGSNEFFPPMNQGAQEGMGTRESQASMPGSAGNQGQKRSRGPNRVAFPEFTVEPTVPLTLIVSGVTNSVDVTVDIAADGSHTEKIVRSSGSSEVDSLVLGALSQWKWDPAARDGQAIASTQNFKFTFKPR